jgi:hypothetical protein
MKRNKHKTDFLLPAVSFITGMGSIFNVSGNYYSFNASKSGAEADCRALRSDWQMIGQDLEKAMSEHEK